MDNLTIIFTVRVDSMQRQLNILSTLKYYISILPKSHIILLEADSSSHLEEIINSQFPDIQYIYIYDENPIFHRTKYINMELRHTLTKFAAVIDSDVVVPVNQISEAVRLLSCGNLIMVLPYDGRFINIDAYFSDLFRNSNNISSICSIDGNQSLMFGFISVGGAFIVNVLEYKKVGWENEFFPGWGPEDFERVNRLSILGYKPLRVEGKIYHLDHPRGINSSNIYEPLILATKREYCKVSSMSRDELRGYIDTWPWIK